MEDEEALWICMLQCTGAEVVRFDSELQAREWLSVGGCCTHRARTVQSFNTHEVSSKGLWQPSTGIWEHPPKWLQWASSLGKISRNTSERCCTVRAPCNSTPLEGQGVILIETFAQQFYCKISPAYVVEVQITVEV